MSPFSPPQPPQPEAPPTVTPTVPVLTPTVLTPNAPTTAAAPAAVAPLATVIAFAPRLPPQHPGDVLNAGVVDDFARALELVQAQCKLEAEISSQIQPDEYWTTDDKQQLLADFAHFAEVAREVAAEWAEQMAVVERVRQRAEQQATAAVVASLRASGDEDRQLIADALESGDYRTLAL